ncbi:MAG: hypothetical protein KGQ41_09910 [Alphaproteobacteria bacterium]|nr:hypothetical protein [Alphaproteobacteria bacterium]
MLEKLPIVGVMGSGEKPWAEWAQPLGAALATLPVHLLTGGGNGTMTAVSKAFTEVSPRQGRTIGIIPTEKQADGTYQAKAGYPNPFIEIPIFTPLGTYAGEGTDFVSRNMVNIMTANAIVALPGSGGTRNEINIAMKFGKPVCLFGTHDLPSDIYGQLPHFAVASDVLAWLKPILEQAS